MTPPIAKDPELTGLAAVQEKLERAKEMLEGDLGRGAVYRISRVKVLSEQDRGFLMNLDDTLNLVHGDISEALALMESEPSKQMRRDHEVGRMVRIFLSDPCVDGEFCRHSDCASRKLPIEEWCWGCRMDKSVFGQSLNRAILGAPAESREDDEQPVKAQPHCRVCGSRIVKFGGAGKQCGGCGSQEEFVRPKNEGE